MQFWAVYRQVDESQLMLSAIFTKENHAQYYAKEYRDYDFIPWILDYGNDLNSVKKFMSVKDARDLGNGIYWE